MFRVGLVWHAIGLLFLSVSTCISLGAILFAVVIGAAMFAAAVPLMAVLMYAATTDGVTFKIGFWTCVVAAATPIFIARLAYSDGGASDSSSGSSSGYSFRC